ncbi:hypothetical protein [Pontibacillus litoralis]|uniref:Uncharacterized protein n=1 Tax=Pontibacillus litoralis JSM 072002 TaxID=1385512 RepID=A0A0A5FYV7_9BACI|nr:hypothetical protein [Pontibacillus litoralis]KGX84003.1 hypothetical protein N784_15300 [Pontibacillus litoralis JSM 072002]
MKLNKLTDTKVKDYKKEEKNVYKVYKKNDFYSKTVIRYEYVALSFSFAYAMAYSEEGHHRRERSDGKKSRNDFEVFCDTFVGKLGEHAVYQYIKENIKGIEIPLPDLTIEGKGKWDTYDFNFEYGGKQRNIGVKTTKHFGNLLMLETEDWDDNGRYIPNKEKETGEYTDFLFVRVNYELIFSLQKRYKHQNEQINPESFASLLSDAHYNFDIHYIPVEYIKNAIENKMIVKKDYYLNTTAPSNELDANNYYIQCGDMLKGYELIKALKR